MEKSGIESQDEEVESQYSVSASEENWGEQPEFSQHERSISQLCQIIRNLKLEKQQLSEVVAIQVQNMAKERKDCEELATLLEKIKLTKENALIKISEANTKTTNLQSKLCDLNEIQDNTLKKYDSVALSIAHAKGELLLLKNKGAQRALIYKTHLAELSFIKDKVEEQSSGVQIKEKLLGRIRHLIQSYCKSAEERIHEIKNEENHKREELKSLEVQFENSERKIEEALREANETEATFENGFQELDEKSRKMNEKLAVYKEQVDEVSTRMEFVSFEQEKLLEIKKDRLNTKALETNVISLLEKDVEMKSYVNMGLSSAIQHLPSPGCDPILEENVKIEKEINEAQNRIEQKTRELESIEMTNSEMTRKIRQLQTDLTNAVEERVEVERQTSSLLFQMERLNFDKENVQKTRLSLAERAQALPGTNETLKNKRKRLSDSLELKNSEKAKCEQKFKDASRELELKRESLKMETERANSLEWEQMNLETKIASEASQVAAIENELKEKTLHCENIKKLKEQISRKEEEISSLREALGDLSDSQSTQRSERWTERDMLKACKEELRNIDLLCETSESRRRRKELKEKRSGMLHESQSSQQAPRRAGDMTPLTDCFNRKTSEKMSQTAREEGTNSQSLFEETEKIDSGKNYFFPDAGKVVSSNLKRTLEGKDSSQGNDKENFPSQVGPHPNKVPCVLDLFNDE